MFASRLVFLLVSPNFGEDQMRILGARIPIFRFRHSFVIRHSSIVISLSPRCAIPCTATPLQIPSHASRLFVKFSGLPRSHRSLVPQNILARLLELFLSRVWSVFPVPRADQQFPLTP